MSALSLSRIALLCALPAHALSAQQPPVPPTPPARAVPRPAPTPRPTTPVAPAAPLNAFSFDFDGLIDARHAAEIARASVDVRHAAEMARASVMIDRDAIQSAALAAARASADAVASINFDGLMDGALSGLYAPMAYSSDRSYRTQPAAPWDSQDQADSLYREGRKALSADAYRKAADIFRQIRDRYPRSSYTPDAPYWEAFALQRLGGDANLRAAQEALAVQQKSYPKAATRGDGAALNARIESALARRGDVEMQRTLLGRANAATRDGCPRANEDERVDALNAVTQMDSEKALPILRKVLARREPCTQQLRRTAVYLVASKRVPDAANLLMNVARTDPDHEVREQAVFWMANVPTEEATTMLVDLAKKGDDLELRKRAVYALSRSKSPRGVATLREISMDSGEPDELRGDAMNWYLASLGKTNPDAMPYLTDMYGKVETPRLKQRVLSLIAARRNDQSREFLMTLAQNSRESIELRRNAVSQLNASGVTNTQLAQLYDRAGDLEVRRQVLSSLASLKDNAGVDKLVDVARNEKNIELRKSAVSYLSRTNDPRALALLQEIIDK